MNFNSIEFLIENNYMYENALDIVKKKKYPSRKGLLTIARLFPMCQPYNVRRIISIKQRNTISIEFSEKSMHHNTRQIRPRRARIDRGFLIIDYLQERNQEFATGRLDVAYGY